MNSYNSSLWLTNCDHTQRRIQSKWKMCWQWRRTTRRFSKLESRQIGHSVTLSLHERLTLLIKLLKISKRCWGDNKRDEFQNTAWEIVFKKHPRQTNGNDCGVFVAKFLEYSIKRQDLQEASEELSNSDACRFNMYNLLAQNSIDPASFCSICRQVRTCIKVINLLRTLIQVLKIIKNFLI